MRTPDFPEYLATYLTNYLPLQQGASVNTIKSYRDSFTIFLRYCRDVQHIKPETLTMSMFSRRLVEEYLLWLEQKHKCSISTRNHRLAVIQAFMRYASVEHPEHLDVCSALMTIKQKHAPTKTIDYLTVKELKVIFARVDTKTDNGKRDLAILALLYDSAARVQELIDLKFGDIHIQVPATVKLWGKGGKARVIPIMPETARIVSRYIAAYNLSKPQQPLFVNRNHINFSRSGIEYIISKYVSLAVPFAESLSGKKVSPHVFRHSKAMHLVQAGVNIVYIRDMLGHVSVQTTEVYAKADSEAKRKALASASKNILPVSKFSAPKKKELLDWLKKLI